MDLFNVTTILLALAVWLLWYHWKTDCQKSLDLSRSSFFTNGHKNSYTEKTNNVQGKHPYCKLFFVKPKVCSFHRKWLQYRFLSPNFVNVFTFLARNVHWRLNCLKTRLFKNDFYRVLKKGRSFMFSTCVSLWSLVRVTKVFPPTK